MARGMVKKAPIIAGVVILAIVAVLVYGTLSASGEETEGENGADGPRIPFVTGLVGFLAFAAGYAARDILGKRAQRPARPPAAGRKTP